MSLVFLLGWWYSRGWAWAVSSTFGRIKEINETFSIPILLRTWFSPWKQITTPSSFRNFFQAAIDNLISRFIGATVRSLLIIGAVLSNLAIIIFGLAVLAAWPIIPLAVVILPILFLGGSS